MNYFRVYRSKIKKFKTLFILFWPTILILNLAIQQLMSMLPPPTKAQDTEIKPNLPNLDKEIASMFTNTPPVPPAPPQNQIKNKESKAQKEQKTLGIANSNEIKKEKTKTVTPSPAPTTLKKLKTEMKKESPKKQINNIISAKTPQLPTTLPPKPSKTESKKTTSSYLQKLENYVDALEKAFCNKIILQKDKQKRPTISPPQKEPVKEKATETTPVITKKTVEKETPPSIKLEEEYLPQETVKEIKKLKEPLLDFLATTTFSTVDEFKKDLEKAQKALENFAEKFEAKINKTQKRNLKENTTQAKKTPFPPEKKISTPQNNIPSPKVAIPPPSPPKKEIKKQSLPPMPPPPSPTTKSKSIPPPPPPLPPKLGPAPSIPPPPPPLPQM